MFQAGPDQQSFRSLHTRPPRPREAGDQRDDLPSYFLAKRCSNAARSCTKRNYLLGQELGQAGNNFFGHNEGRKVGLCARLEVFENHEVDWHSFEKGGADELGGLQCQQFMG